MSAPKKRAKRYCVAYGCLHKDMDGDLSMFRLPTNMTRCKEWLALINREDLLQKPNFYPPSYAICEQHFDESMFKKGLRPGAKPRKIHLNEIPVEQRKYFEIEVPPLEPRETYEILIKDEASDESDEETKSMGSLKASTSRKRKVSEEDKVISKRPVIYIKDEGDNESESE